MNKKQEYLEAVERAPEVVASDTDPFIFLRTCDYDFWAAANRLCYYWKKRKEIFQDKAFLPLKMSAGGALSYEDTLTIEAGYPALLPRTKDGRHVMFLNRNRFLRASTNINNWLRALFYIVKVVGEDERSQSENGVLVLTALVLPRITDSEEALRRINWDLAVNAFPNRFEIHSLCLLPRTMRGPAPFPEILNRPVHSKRNYIEQLISVAMSTPTRFSFQIHVEQEESAMRDRLIKMGMSPDGIPDCFGGEWSFSSVMEFCRLQTWKESNYANSGSLLDQDVGMRLSSEFASDGDTKTKPGQVTDESLKRKRMNNAIQSRRKRERRRQEFQQFKQECETLSIANKKLRMEHNKLSALITQASVVVRATMLGSSNDPSVYSNSVSVMTGRGTTPASADASHDSNVMTSPVCHNKRHSQHKKNAKGAHLQVTNFVEGLQKTINSQSDTIHVSAATNATRESEVECGDATHSHQMKQKISHIASPQNEIITVLSALQPVPTLQNDWKSPEPGFPAQYFEPLPNEEDLQLLLQQRGTITKADKLVEPENTKVAHQLELQEMQLQQGHRSWQRYDGPTWEQADHAHCSQNDWEQQQLYDQQLLPFQSHHRSTFDAKTGFSARGSAQTQQEHQNRTVEIEGNSHKEERSNAFHDFNFDDLFPDPIAENITVVDQRAWNKSCQFNQMRQSMEQQQNNTIIGTKMLPSKDNFEFTPKTQQEHQLAIVDIEGNSRKEEQSNELHGFDLDDLLPDPIGGNITVVDQRGNKIRKGCQTTEHSQHNAIIGYEILPIDENFGFTPNLPDMNHGILDFVSHYFPFGGVDPSTSRNAGFSNSLATVCHTTDQFGNDKSSRTASVRSQRTTFPNAFN